MKNRVRKWTAMAVAAAMLSLNMTVVAVESRPAGADVSHCATATKPVSERNSYFLTGNGNMGVMMGGNPYAETLIVDARLYQPMNQKKILPDLAPFKDEFKKAGLAAGIQGPAVVHKMMMEKSDHKMAEADNLHAAFQLLLSMKGTAEGVTQYRMTEDFSTGELHVQWSDAQGDWQRKLFVSRTDDVVVLLIEGPKGKVNCEFAMVDGHACLQSEREVAPPWICAHHAYRRGYGGYDNLVRIAPNGGQMSKQRNGIGVTGADSILVLMRVKPWKKAMPKDQSEAWDTSPENPDFGKSDSSRGILAMKEAMARLPADYARLFESHVQVHGALYNRVRLDLDGGADRGMSSEELLAQAVNEGRLSKALAERMYNACRYLIICSSGQTPPNLQGIWAAGWGSAWGGSYTLDSNLELEVQSTMSCNMPELMAGYFDLVDSWVPDWRLNAKKIYGFRGVAANAVGAGSSLLLGWKPWPGEMASIGIAGWLLHFYHDYYLFTGDRKFLAERFVPFAKEIALFYEDFLAGTEDANGKYRFYMSYSPEQGLIAPNSTYDIAIAKNVLSTLIAACKELGVEQQHIPAWEAMLAKMPPYLVNSKGALQEWAWPEASQSYNHRHHSPFLPLYQFCEFDRDATPELWKASELAFEEKIRQWFRNEKVVGGRHITHGMMNQGQCAARLGRGDVVHEVLSRLATRQYLFPSFMMSINPELGGFGFDSVGTTPDIINNALIFAWNGTVDVLPALPREWPKGSIRGVRLRGQIFVRDLAWNIPAGRVSLTLESDKTQTVRLRFPPSWRTEPVAGPVADAYQLVLEKGHPMQVEFKVVQAGIKAD